MNHGIKRLFLFSRIIFLLMSLVLPSVCSCAETNTSSDVYAASLTDAAVFINVPALRQYGDYTCGATCVQMLMNWLYPYEADRNLTQYEEALLTSPEIGTSPQALLNYFEEAKATVGGQTPHMLTKAFSFHNNLAEHGTMLP